MNRLTLLFILLTLLVSRAGYTQNISDVVRWSTLDYAGTARTLGAGSAFGAMGGDFSVVNINPSGIADYRISEFTFTPSLRSAKTDAYFVSNQDANLITKGTRLGLDNIGFVVARNPGSNWTSSNFAMGYSRTADFHRKVSIEGKIPGSVTRYFSEQANGRVPDALDDFVAYPAYNTGAIFDFDNDNYYETDFDNYDGPVKRIQNISQKGGVNELTLGWAGEYKNDLSMGISVGVPFSSFEEEKNYNESDDAGEILAFNSLQYTERLSTTGVGFNFKAGFRYRIAQRIRIAGAFHSPTWNKFTDDYSTTMTYAYNDGENKEYSYDSPDGTFEYRITSPWRATGSLGTTFKAGDLVGFVNADLEYLDYTNATYNGTAYDNSNEERQWTNQVNNDIQKRLGTATNLRLGGELGYRNLRLRAGYSWERTAFNADDFYNNKLSYGLGFREDNFFFDLGFRTAVYKEGYNPYVVLDSELDPLANIKTTRTRAALTLGFKF